MFSSEGEIWKQKHDLLQPMMKHSVLQHNTEIVHSKMEKLMEKLSKLSLNQNQQLELEIVRYLKQVTVDVIGEFAFGVDFHSLDEGEDNKFSKIANGILNGINLRFIVPPFLWWLPLPTFIREKRYLRQLNELFDDILDEYKKKRGEGIKDENNLISILLSIHENDPELAKRIYPREHMLGECFSIWGAGHDTTTYTIAHTLKLLSENEDVQEKLRSEIFDFINSAIDCVHPSYEDIHKLKYMDMVLKESQRLYPIAPLFVRQSDNDVVLNGVNFPKNTLIGIGVREIQASEQYFHEAEKFLPERWNEANHANLPFYTFGFGIRGCFGRKLATLEMKCFLFHFLQRYRILNNSDKHPHICESDFGYVPQNKQLHVLITPIN